MIKLPNASSRSWRWLIARIGAMFVSLAVLVALLPAPARSQSESPYAPNDPPEAREGIWVGEAVAFGTLRGTTEGGSAVWVGALESLITLDVDAAGLISGDWILDGEAVMEVEVSEPILITQIYDGSGSFRDRQNVAGAIGREFDMLGDVSTWGTVSTAAGAIDVGPFESTFQSFVTIRKADCYELIGDWIPQLEQLASDEGWQDSDIHGSFKVSFVGDEIADEILRDFKQLAADAEAWQEELIASGIVDVAGLFALMGRARAISLALHSSVDCIRSNHPDPEFYDATLAGAFGLAMSQALQARSFSGSALRDMVTAMGALGGSSTARYVSSEIQIQTQRIISDNVTSTGCDPWCVREGSESEVIDAAIAGKLLGQEFEVEVYLVEPDDIIGAAAGT